MQNSIAGVLVLVSFLVFQVAAEGPYPGSNCNFNSQCNSEKSMMVCRGFGGNPPTCICEKFMADPKYNVTTVPTYSEDKKMCVVKKGEPCLVEAYNKLVMQCEADARCDTDLGPETKDAGLCSAGVGSGSRISLAMYFIGTLFAVVFSTKTELGF